VKHPATLPTSPAARRAAYDRAFLRLDLVRRALHAAGILHRRSQEKLGGDVEALGGVVGVLEREHEHAAAALTRALEGMRP